MHADLRVASEIAGRAPSRAAEGGTMNLLFTMLLLGTLAWGQTFTFSTPQPSHRGTLTKVDTLTDAEKAERKRVSDALAKAQSDYDAAMEKIRQAHGEHHCPIVNYAVYCTGGSDAVIEDDFVLIYNWQSLETSVLGW